MMSWKVGLVVFVGCCCWTAESLICADDVQGTCETDARGWCYFNRTTGAFNCDDQKICDASASIRNTKIQTCLAPDQKDCCCNKGQTDVKDYCNYELVTVLTYKEGSEVNYKCNRNAFDNTNDWSTNLCADRWCTSLMFKDNAKRLVKGNINSCQVEMAKSRAKMLAGDEKFKDEKSYQVLELEREPSFVTSSHGCSHFWGKPKASVLGACGNEEQISSNWMCRLYDTTIVKPVRELQMLTFTKIFDAFKQKVPLNCDNITALQTPWRDSVCVQENNIKVGSATYTVRYCCCIGDECNASHDWNNKLTEIPVGSSVSVGAMVQLVVAAVVFILAVC